MHASCKGKHSVMKDKVNKALFLFALHLFIYYISGSCDNYRIDLVGFGGGKLTYNHKQPQLRHN